MTGMTNPHPDAPAAAPARVQVASYATHAEAQRAVGVLADRKFAAEGLAIVAEGLTLVEQGTGRLTWGRALSGGLLSGAVTGVFVGLLFGLFSLSSVAVASLLLYGLVAGAVIGALWALVAYGLSGGRRDFTSVGGLQADRYSVMADPALAPEAQRLLASLPR